MGFIGFLGLWGLGFRVHIELRAQDPDSPAQEA